jgi:hypothetical protein
MPDAARSKVRLSGSSVAMRSVPVRVLPFDVAGGAKRTV